MAIEPASNGADELTDSSAEDAALVQAVLRQQQLAQNNSNHIHPVRAADSAVDAAVDSGAGAAGERDRLRSPQVALSQRINAFNAFNRAEEEAAFIQDDSARLFSEQSRSIGAPTGVSQPANAIATSRQDSLRNYSRTEAYRGVPPAAKQRRGWFGWRKQDHRALGDRATNNLPPGTSLVTPPFTPGAPHPTGFSPEATPYPLPNASPDTPLDPTIAHPLPPQAGQYVINPLDGSAIFVPARPPLPAWWEKQPYYALAHALAIGGTVTVAWLLGILAAQVLPGNFQQPPFQEALLRRSSRLTRRLWHVPGLWQTPTAETRIEAIPLPETGPILAPISLPPVEKQPLVDELNAIETEILTLDRRMQTIEKRLGKPPYQGADVESRINALRAAIDPPVRSSDPSADEAYKPTPTDPNDQLLEVAKLKIVLPSDALFSPGQSDLKGTPLQDQVLKQVLDQLVNYPPESTIVIRSYSDDQAKVSDSLDYTLAQSNTLRAHLQAALPDSYRWVAIGGGQAQPSSSNTDDTGRQRNRRIEILVDTRRRS